MSTGKDGTDDMPATVGVIGLGIMGAAIARNLAAAGRSVVGYDTDAERCRSAAADGVQVEASSEAVGTAADVVLTSLPSVAALDATAGALAANPRPGLVVAELSTLPLDCKRANRERLAAAGVVLLDCPLSGTGAQAASGDLSIYASGDEAAYRRCSGVFDDFSRIAYYLGEFGNGTKMKFVANLLVAVHNVAAAEAVVLGLHAGLDPATLVEIAGSGAGGSRVLELRGPMMVSGKFEPATMKLDVWQKDMRLIGEFAADCGVVTPLFSAADSLYKSALERGLGQQDTAAIAAVLEQMSEAGGKPGG